MASVLIIDPDAIVREAVGEVLTAQGYKVFRAADPRDALAALASRPVDVVLTEIEFPGSPEREFLASLRRACSAPVVVLSGVTERSRILAVVEFGIAGYLLKQQFTVDLLLKKLTAALRKADQQPAAPRSASAPAAPAAAPPPAASLADLKPILSRSQLQELLDSFGELRALSPTVAQLIKLTGSPNVSMESIVKVIKTDHAIALKMIKLANSAVFSRGEPVNSVKTAVLRIGTEQIRQAVLNISVIDRFGSAELGERIQQGRFWEHAIGCGIIASELARASRSVEPDNAFTMGLLHDVGQLVLAEQLGDRYATVLRTAAELSVPLEQVEKRMLLMDHAEIMDRLLHAWHFPRDLIDPIVFHHLSAGNIRKIASRKVAETCTVALANRLASALLLGCSGNMSIYPTEELCDALRITGTDVARIEESVPNETDEVKLALLSSGNLGSWQPVREAWRARLPDEFRPLVVSSRPEIDAVRILCDTLRDRTDAAPTLAVVRIAHVRERVPLTNTLRAAEADAGTPDLPLLLVSPAGQIRLDERLMQSRRVASLAIPFTLTQFVQAVASLTEESPARAAA